MTEPLVVGDIFRNAARAVPHRPAAAMGERSLTFAEVDSLANRTATRRGRWGVGPRRSGGHLGGNHPGGRSAVRCAGQARCRVRTTQRTVGRGGDDPVLDRLRPGLLLVDTRPRVVRGLAVRAGAYGLDVLSFESLTAAHRRSRRKTPGARR